MGRDRGKAARCEKKSLLTHPVSYTHTTEGAARNEAQGTRNEQLFTVYCSLFTVHYKGIFPCFFLGNFTALVSSIRKALISFERVWSGRITSST